LQDEQTCRSYYGFDIAPERFVLIGDYDSDGYQEISIRTCKNILPSLFVISPLTNTIWSSTAPVTNLQAYIDYPKDSSNRLHPIITSSIGDDRTKGWVIFRPDLPSSPECLGGKSCIAPITSIVRESGVTFKI
jgi:hypothetical protein